MISLWTILIVIMCCLVGGMVWGISAYLEEKHWRREIFRHNAKWKGLRKHP